MPEGGEGTLIVVPGGSEVGTSTVGGVQTPSRLGGWREQRWTEHTHIQMYTPTETHKHDTEGQEHKRSEEKETEKYEQHITYAGCFMGCNQLAAILEVLSIAMKNENDLFRL